MKVCMIIFFKYFHIWFISLLTITSFLLLITSWEKDGDLTFLIITSNKHLNNPIFFHLITRERKAVSFSLSCCLWRGKWEISPHPISNINQGGGCGCWCGKWLESKRKGWACYVIRRIRRHPSIIENFIKIIIFDVIYNKDLYPIEVAYGLERALTLVGDGKFDFTPSSITQHHDKNNTYHHGQR